jgi:hypothetical protein
VKAGVQTHIWLRSVLTHTSKVVLEECLDLSTNRGTTDVECAAISSVHSVGIIGRRDLMVVSHISSQKASTNMSQKT